MTPYWCVHMDLLNSHYRQIQFTIDLEHKILSFLERKPDRTLGQSVYQKPTHANLYTRRLSHYHPAQKAEFVSTLLYRAKNIADVEDLPTELAFLREAFLLQWVCKERDRSSHRWPQ